MNKKSITLYTVMESYFDANDIHEEIVVGSPTFFNTKEEAIEESKNWKDCKVVSVEMIINA